MIEIKTYNETEDHFNIIFKVHAESKMLYIQQLTEIINKFYDLDEPCFTQALADSRYYDHVMKATEGMDL